MDIITTLQDAASENLTSIITALVALLLFAIPFAMLKPMYRWLTNYMNGA